MKKKGFVFLLTLLLSLGVVACQTTEATTTTTTTSGTTTGTTTTTTSGTTATTTTTAAFTIALSGLADAGFTEEDKILTGQYFDLLEGVHAWGSDGVDYAANILLQTEDAVCQIDAGTLHSNSAKVCTITYTIVVNSKLARANRLVKISAAPIVMEFTQTDLFDNDALFGTDYVVTTTDPGVNQFHYWTESAAILGTTGSVQILGGKLVIAQESMGGVGYALQAVALTQVPLEKGRYYKITMTITSDTARVIDIVTKAPNNDYANDTHSLIEIAVGTAEYEMIFVANQDVLHLNIMTGAVEGNLNAGTLQFSAFTLFEGPIVIDYTELAGFFTNTDVATGTTIDYITTTDADYVREFYYWDQSSGALMSGVTTATGIDVTVITAAANDYGIQLQWNDMTKQGVALKKDANYKLTFSVDSEVARSMIVAITGSSNGLASSASQSFDLNVGMNDIVLEFVSLYDYFFMKIQLGNYGDLVQTGLFSFTDFKLFEETGAVAPEEPVDEGAVIGNIFGTVANTEGALQINPATDPEGEFFLWAGYAFDWNTGWTAFAEVAGTYAPGKVTVDITNESAPEFWGIQLKYHGGALTVGTDYLLSFVVTSDVARTINVEVHNASGQYVTQNIDVVVGVNYIELPFTAQFNKFNLQVNLGNFSVDDESGVLVFENFVLSRPVQEVEGYVVNGDFATAQSFGTADADGWAYWSTQGIGDAWALPNYNGTATIADGVLTVVNTQIGGAIWACQIQYNHVGADMTVGAVYKVEFDVNSTVATSIAVELKGATDAANQDVIVSLKAGDNHVTVFFVASQERFRFFIMPGLADPSTMVFDNLKYSEPIVPVVIPEIEYVESNTPIINGDFGTDGMTIPVSADGVQSPSSWSYWDTTGQSSWTTEVSANVSIVNGQAVVETLGTGDFVWSIQLQYRPAFGTANIVTGGKYKVEFDVNASVAGSFSMELTTTGNAGNIAFPVTLVVGDNHVVIEFVAYEAKLMLTASLGQYGAAVLKFDNFVLYEEAVHTFVNVDSGVVNGDFNTVDMTIPMSADGVDPAFSWSYWNTIGQSSWTTEVGCNVSIVDGKAVVETLGTGDFVWSIQLQYRPLADVKALIPGDKYKVEFDVNATVAGTFSMELTTTGNAGNVAFPTTLVVGDNHVVIEFTAYEAKLMLTASLGQYGAAVLTFDNFVLKHDAISNQHVQYVASDVSIVNGDFEAVGFAVNGLDSSWTSWTTVAETWTTQVDATFTVTDGEVVVETLGVGDYVWSIQFCYRPAAGVENVISGNYYRVEFDVNASVAGTFSMEMTTTGNFANKATPVTLVVGDNHVVIYFMAMQKDLMLTACLGQYGAAILKFDNFKVFEEAQYAFVAVNNGIVNGDFSTVDMTIPMSADGVDPAFSWSYWNTIGQGSWTTEVGCNVSIVDGKAVVETLGTGAFVWSIQLQYRPVAGVQDVVAGDVYKVEFDVNATVAGTFSMELTTTGNAGNIAFPITLVVGDNHVVIEFTAFEAKLMLTASIGQYGAAVLTFDNFVISHYEVTNGPIA